MLLPDETHRQRLIRLLTEHRLSSRQLAERLGISERQVEAHLEHVVRSLRHDRTRRFLLEPPICHHCGFEFPGRTRLTRPSRCPKCRSESISVPRYGIEHVESTRAEAEGAPDIGTG